MSRSAFNNISNKLLLSHLKNCCNLNRNLELSDLLTIPIFYC